MSTIPNQERYSFLVTCRTTYAGGITETRAGGKFLPQLRRSPGDVCIIRRRGWSRVVSEPCAPDGYQRLERHLNWCVTITGDRFCLRSGADGHHFGVPVLKLARYPLAILGLVFDARKNTRTDPTRRTSTPESLTQQTVRRSPSEQAADDAARCCRSELARCAGRRDIENPPAANSTPGSCRTGCRALLSDGAPPDRLA